MLARGPHRPRVSRAARPDRWFHSRRQANVAVDVRLISFVALAVTWTACAHRTVVPAVDPRAAPQFEIEAGREGEPRLARVKVWVDDEVRRQRPRWNAEIDEEIDDVNQVLVPALGVRLEVSAVEAWPTSNASRSLEQIAAALEVHDPGDGAAWVIGYAAAPATLPAAFDQQALAHPFGRHVVVLTAADGDGPTDATDGARLAERRRHRRVAVLLHTLGHSLGAPHELDPSWIMHPDYGAPIRRLSVRSRELMTIGLAARLEGGAPTDRRQLAARLIGHIEADPWGGWDPNELRTWVAGLRALGDAAPSAPSANADLPLPPAALEQLQRAERLAQRGAFGDALAELDILLLAYPASAQAHQARCEAQIGRRGVDHADSEAACRRAAEISPQDPRPFLARAAAHLRGGDRTSGLADLERAAERAGDRPDVWDQLATIYQGLGMVTRAEASAARSTALRSAAEPHAVQVWANRTRARYGLPPDARRWKIAAEDEGEYVAAVRELLDLVYADQPGRALAKAAAAERRWRGAPGLLAARCDLALRAGDLPKARAMCKQAIGAWAGAAWAHYLTGVIAYQSRQLAAAAAALRLAIASDPELSHAYRALGKTLKALGDADARGALAVEYQRRFGAALPD